MPFSSEAALSRPSSIDDVGLGHVGRDQPHVLQRLDPHAAQADQHDRAPVGIALGADHQLEPARAHRLDQHAVELQLGPVRRHVGVQALPALAQRRFVGQADDDAADVALVRQLARLRLDDDRVADVGRDAQRLVDAARQRAVRHCEAGRGEPGLALVLGAARPTAAAASGSGSGAAVPALARAARCSASP